MFGENSASRHQACRAHSYKYRASGFMDTLDDCVFTQHGIAFEHAPGRPRAGLVVRLTAACILLL